MINISMNISRKISNYTNIRLERSNVTGQEADQLNEYVTLGQLLDIFQGGGNIQLTFENISNTNLTATAERTFTILNNLLQSFTILDETGVNFLRFKTTTAGGGKKLFVGVPLDVTGDIVTNARIISQNARYLGVLVGANTDFLLSIDQTTGDVKRTSLTVDEILTNIGAEFIVDEFNGPVIAASNPSFTLSQIPNQPDVFLYINGLYIPPSNYTLTSNMITISTYQGYPIDSNDVIVAKYK